MYLEFETQTKPARSSWQEEVIEPETQKAVTLYHLSETDVSLKESKDRQKRLSEL